MGALLVALAILALFLLAIYLKSKQKFNYWKNKNVPHLKPTPIFGNYGNFLMLKNVMGLDAQKMCQQFPNEPYIGAYIGTEPALIVQDLELIKLVTTKDFYYFNSRDIADHTHKEILTGNLFFTHGDRWKVIRQNMTPLFTTLKIKNMFHLVEKCTRCFEDMLDYEVNKSPVLDMKAIIARYTMDCISSCGFGVDTNTMAKDVKNNPFTKMGEEIFKNSNLRGIALYSRTIWPSIFYGIGLQLFPQVITDFFHKLLTGVFHERQYKPSMRNDFVDMVLNLKKNDYITTSSFKNKEETVTMKVDDEFLVAQCALFFAAGYETSAVTSSFTLYELAKSEKAQTKAIADVDAYLLKRGNKIDYDCVSELPFLEACIDEVMRLYPALNVITREVVEDYTLPTGLRLDKGVRIHLPVYHLHHNPDYFPEPEEFRPERFLPGARQNIKPYTYMPFGEGPRICIGKQIVSFYL